MSQCCWENEVDRFAQCRVATKFQVVKNAIFAKCNNCSHEIKRRLLLRRKIMTNLDSILKSRDSTLSTRLCLVKAMVFPLVMYGCESWTTKKAEH